MSYSNRFLAEVSRICVRAKLRVKKFNHGCTQMDTDKEMGNGEKIDNHEIHQTHKMGEEGVAEVCASFWSAPVFWRFVHQQLVESGRVLPQSRTLRAVPMRGNVSQGSWLSVEWASKK